MPRPRHLAAVWSVSVAAALAAGGSASANGQAGPGGDGDAAAPVQTPALEIGDITAGTNSSPSITRSPRSGEGGRQS
jgi:hypothetical protein